MGVLSLEEDYSEISDIEEQINGLTRDRRYFFTPRMYSPSCDLSRLEKRTLWLLRSEKILRDVMSRGVADPDVQLELLSQVNQNITLEEVFTFVQTKEAGKRFVLTVTQVLSRANTRWGRMRLDLRNSGRQETSSKCSYCGK